MVADSRVTYRRRHCYATRSNKVKVIKTPGSRFTVQYRKKRAAAPKCGDCGKALPGLLALRPKEYKHAKRHQKTVSRKYGGAVCAGCVRTRILRAFLVEEKKAVKKVQKAKAQKESSKSGKKSSSKKR
eukprot:g3924.t1